MHDFLHFRFELQSERSHRFDFQNPCRLSFRLMCFGGRSGSYCFRIGKERRGSRNTMFPLRNQRSTRLNMRFGSLLSILLRKFFFFFLWFLSRLFWFWSRVLICLGSSACGQQGSKIYQLCWGEWLFSTEFGSTICLYILFAIVCQVERKSFVFLKRNNRGFLARLGLEQNSCQFLKNSIRLVELTWRIKFE